MDESIAKEFMRDRYNVSRETFERLQIYQSLLIKWQKAVNIVSRGTLDSFWKRHVLDSLQLSTYIKGKQVLDIGSGGGFPGMILAICTDFQITCLDSDRKKMIFLEEVARLTSTNVRILTMRAEELDEKFDTICARGFSSLTNLLSLTYSHAEYGVFLKGQKLQQEISEAKQYHDFSYQIFNSETDSSGNIIVINNIIEK
ncbi:MAG: 16S rRNA (guanine(527)-N(7))-methyltransferase RsmG [Alphaproteobacteria bacterium]|nr:16S rRNA (guanine(527)-N(7))-methyltransferase RsmG [Alphaproteobacteria bacterium]